MWSTTPLTVEIITYGMISKADVLAHYTKNPPDIMILDEAHLIKNHKTVRAKACYKIGKKTPRRVALTGTPAPKEPWEVFGILHFLQPKYYSSYWNFIEKYFIQKKMFVSGHTFNKICGFKEGMDEVLQKEMSCFCTNRKRKEVMEWLPDKDYNKIYLEPTKEQEESIAEMLEFFIVSGTEIEAQGILDQLLRIRQITVFPRSIGLTDEGAKICWTKSYFSDIINEPTHKIIVFSKFTAPLKYINELFPKNSVVITGEVNQKNRDIRLDKFRDDKKCHFLLAQIDTCKEGLTLDHAEEIIFLDKFPPPADVEQAEDRFIASVRERADKGHKITELILKDTYDEQLYQLVEDKASNIDVVNNFRAYVKERSKK